MPTYEFRCAAGHVTDRFYPRFSDSPRDIECPECGEIAVRQVSGGAGLLFKGSGFYITDYARKPQKEEGATETSPKPDSGGEKSSTTSESKPAESKAGSSDTSSGSKSSDK